jgi:hypothetical protein
MVFAGIQFFCISEDVFLIAASLNEGGAVMAG